MKQRYVVTVPEIYFNEFWVEAESKEEVLEEVKRLYLANEVPGESYFHDIDRCGDIILLTDQGEEFTYDTDILDVDLPISTARALEDEDENEEEEEE